MQTQIFKDEVDAQIAACLVPVYMNATKARADKDPEGRHIVVYNLSDDEDFGDLRLDMACWEHIRSDAAKMF